MAREAERTDAQVVRDVLAGDRDAFRLLVRRYGDVMFEHAMRMVGEHDIATDLVQDAMVTGYQKLRTCRDRDRIGAWLFRILANRCRDHLRAARRRPMVSLDRASDIPSAGVPDEDVARKETARQLRDALDRITPEQREAFVLKHVEGRSYEEMAAVMDTSVASLKMRVHRARESLQPLLAEFR